MTQTSNDRNECILSIPFCGSCLKLTRPHRSPQFYGEEQDGEKKKNDFEIILQDSNISKKVERVNTLKEFIKEKNCSPFDDISENLEDFTLIISTLIEKGRLISSEEIYGFLEEYFDLEISKILPKMNNGFLEFYTVMSSDPIGEFEVFRVWFSTVDFEVRIKKLSKK